jgi:uncharacterized protein YbcV (DUF1398 family)
VSHDILSFVSNAGVNFIDTADGYPMGAEPSLVGRAEEILGHWLNGKRERFIVAAKGGAPTHGGKSSMSKAIENLEAAQKRALAIRPKVGGFPYLAETLRRAGVTRNFWFLPACQSLFLTNHGPVVAQGTPLATGTMDVPSFNREALISALRTDQAGESTFPEFLVASWLAGVVRYDVDFTARTVAYYGCNGEEYVEAYPVVEIDPE